jgi:uncharacterized protein YbjT (DUF2867 family)
METLALFGGSGRTGRRVLEVAAQRGVGVRGLVRRAGSLGESEDVTEIVGTLDSAPDIDRTFEQCTAACLVFGPHPPHAEVFCAEATRMILAGMERQCVRRIICVTGAMIGAYPQNRTWVFNQATAVYQRRQPEPHQDRVGQEELIRQSGFSWTLVKPPRLTDRGPGGALRAGPDVSVGLISTVSRRELAEVLVDEALNPRFEGQAVFLKGQRNRRRPHHV